MAEDAASRPVTPATPTRKAEASQAAAPASSQDVQASGPAAAEAKPGSVSLQMAPPRPPAGSSAGSAAIPIPRSTSSSALPAHSTWGKASKAQAAPPRAAAPQPDASGDRARLQQFATCWAQPRGAGSPASKDGSTTDSSLKGASRGRQLCLRGPPGQRAAGQQPGAAPADWAAGGSCSPRASRQDRQALARSTARQLPQVGQPSGQQPHRSAGRGASRVRGG